MKRLTLLLALLAAPAGATPMWEVADQWRCYVDLHVTASIAGEILGVDTGGHIALDFSAGTQEGMVVGRVGTIRHKEYFETPRIGHTLIVTEFDGQAHPWVVTEQNGAWSWTTGTAVSPDGKLWLTHYSCKPTADW